ncbi:MAG: glycosyltransferase family 1 protein [Sphingobacteriales bacterium]|nr:MAG: glycosyltransferase family 1 protein [Sphingobacteriales bacterium]
MKRIKLLRITTAPISLRLLITGQPEYMQESGFEVILISADGDDWALMPNLNKFQHIKIDMARQISLVKDAKALMQLTKLFRKIKPDIVHSHTPKAGLLAMMAAKASGVPVRIHTLAGMPLMTTFGIKRKILTWAEKMTYTCAGEVWPNSKELSKYILQNKLIDPEKSRMILNGSSNGIDLSRYSSNNLSLARIEEIKRQYDIADTDFIFLAVGRVVKDKGIEELVDAFSFINNQYPHTKLFILGPFEKANAVSDEVKATIQSHPKVTHISWSDEVEYFMGLAKCFVHASHREGFPNVVLQAGAMQCPVICSNITGNIDIVESENEGSTYRVKDKNALISKMEWVLNNYNEAQKKAENLQQKIYNNFNRQAVFAAIKQRYIQLLKEKNIDVSGIH